MSTYFTNTGQKSYLATPVTIDYTTVSEYYEPTGYFTRTNYGGFNVVEDVITYTGQNNYFLFNLTGTVQSSTPNTIFTFALIINDVLDTWSETIIQTEKVTDIITFNLVSINHLQAGDTLKFKFKADKEADITLHTFFGIVQPF